MCDRAGRRVGLKVTMGKDCRFLFPKLGLKISLGKKGKRPKTFVSILKRIALIVAPRAGAWTENRKGSTNRPIFALR